MDRTTEIITVVRFVMPPPLAGSLAGLAARGLGAVALAPGAAGVGSKEGLAVLTLTLGGWMSHWPASPQTNDLHIAVQKEEKEGRTSGPKKIEENRRSG
jgi:hypothetical protein